MALTLTSNSFKEGATLGMEHILSADYGFGCGGGNKSPHLSWSGAPAGTKSFALHCFDPDAPTGSGFWHWVVVNIPANTTELKLDAGNPASGLLPKGALQTRTDLGKPGYGGPCPPEGHGRAGRQICACGSGPPSSRQRECWDAGNRNLADKTVTARKAPIVERHAVWCRLDL